MWVTGWVRNTAKAHLNFEIGFWWWSTAKLKKLGDIAVDSQKYHEATGSTLLGHTVTQSSQSHRVPHQEKQCTSTSTDEPMGRCAEWCWWSMLCASNCFKQSLVTGCTGYWARSIMSLRLQEEVCGTTWCETPCGGHWSTQHDAFEIWGVSWQLCSWWVMSSISLRSSHVD